jgi:hypothetical protein
MPELDYSFTLFSALFVLEMSPQVYISYWQVIDGLQVESIYVR